jgi:hypothetical protein
LVFSTRSVDLARNEPAAAQEARAAMQERLHAAAEAWTAPRSNCD